MSTTSARALGSAQLALGALLVTRPGALAGHAPLWLVRLLGGRGVLQGAMTLLEPGATTLALGACIDAAHALSMIPVVAGSSRYRRPAAVSGGVAAVMAVAGLGLARSRTPAVQV
jgi:hypothetical protein